MGLIAILEASRLDFLDATRNISPEQASAKPHPGRWSVLECIEHVAAVEDRYVTWIENGAPSTPRPDAEKEIRLFTMLRSRLTKVEAPEISRPHGRFRALDEALAEFQAMRDRTVQLVRKQGHNLYAITVKHPYFGKLNGVEMIQVIDAHGRRHADQIRENCETLPQEIRMKPTKVKKPTAIKRDEPDLPADLESAESFEDGVIQEKRVQDLDRTMLKLDNFRMEGSVLERVQLAGSQFGSAVWKDVRLIGCDLANIRAHRISLVRVEFIDCRLTGFTATALDWQDILVRNGDLRYAQLQGGKFRTCEFAGCNWQEADVQNADLTGASFRTCNLALADFRGTKLENTDFRTSEVVGMLVGMNDLKGAIADASQAMIFAQVLGLQIR
jgi:uncharacterized protein YjbI with pentapeptide repeats